MSNNVINKLCMVFIIAMLVNAGPVSAGENTQDDNWQFGFGLYGWGSSIGGKNAAGNDIQLELSDILDNLNFVAMGVVGARKGRWTFGADIIYLDLEGDRDSRVPVLGGVAGVNTGVELESWVVTPAAGYSVVDSENFSFNVIGGARYLSLKTDVNVHANTPSRPQLAQVVVSGNVWDAIIGVKGNYAFNKHWYIPYYLDIGTGDSDFTWQASAGIGYRFSACDVVLIYRYLSWDFDNNPVLDNMDISGPLLGVKFMF